MSIDEIRRTIAEQKRLIDKATEEVKTAPADIRLRQEKILQLVKEELAAAENELVKY